MHHVHRGRRIVASYAILHLTVTASFVVIGVLCRAPLQRFIMGAVFQTMLIHSLWKGSRWAQWIHVLTFLGWTTILTLLCLKWPRPGVVLVLGVPMLVLGWLAYMFAFSRCVRDFLAYQRGELVFAAAYAPVGGPAAPIRLPLEEERDADSTPCGHCGRMLRNFVLLCPDCGARREAI